MPSKLLPPDKICALILAALSITLKIISTADRAFSSPCGANYSLQTSKENIWFRQILILSWQNACSLCHEKMYFADFHRTIKSARCDHLLVLVVLDELKLYQEPEAGNSQWLFNSGWKDGSLWKVGSNVFYICIGPKILWSVLIKNKKTFQ